MKRVIYIIICSISFWACGAEIGDDCSFDVDCSANMDRYCDSSQPEGYCLIIGCGPDECPEESSCVNFITPCPTGAGYDEGGPKCSLIEPNRGRTYCIKHCKSNKDCRSKYRCEEPKNLSAEIIDFSGNSSKICVPE